MPFIATGPDIPAAGISDGFHDRLSGLRRELYELALEKLP
jgi:hypothetical protein